jgi:hypothetical protein
MGTVATDEALEMATVLLALGVALLGLRWLVDDCGASKGVARVASGVLGTLGVLVVAGLIRALLAVAESLRH